MDRKVRAVWIVISLLCISSIMVPWLHLYGSTEFTSGKPERTELILEIDVDGNEVTQEMRIEQATPFFMWLLVRDSVEENVTVEEEERSGGGDAQNLNNMRTFVMITVFSTALLAGFAALRGGIRMRWALSIWMIGLLMFAIGVPMAWMMDMGDSLDDGLPEDQGPGESFYHVNSNTGTEVVFIGFEFHFEGNGWDLGMVDEEEREAVKEAPPEDPENEHDANIGWDGEISLRYGDALTIWLAIGLLLALIFILERQKNPKYPEDEAE